MSYLTEVSMWRGRVGLDSAGDVVRVSRLLGFRSAIAFILEAKKLPEDEARELVEEAKKELDRQILKGETW